MPCHRHGVVGSVRSVSYGCRSMQRLRPLSEDECYLRCYGWVGTDDVRVVSAGSASPAPVADAAATERIRLGLEERLAEREVEAA